MTGPESIPHPPFARAAIAGIGLLGGSLAAAIKARNLADCVVGIGRNVHRLKAAQDAGLIDTFATEATAVADAELIVLCTPVEHIVRELSEFATHCRPGALITDVGSVKRSIVAAGDRLSPGIHFIGAHPLAGSEKQGFEHADASLFERRLCVLTPSANTPEAAVNQVRAFWSAVGMKTRIMSPEGHDEALAVTSHLPHLTAAVLAGSLPAEYRDLTGTGFRDTTRIAAGDPELWVQILLSNDDFLAASLDRIRQHLQEFQSAVQRRDANALRVLLQQAKANRDALE